MSRKRFAGLMTAVLVLMLIVPLHVGALAGGSMILYVGIHYDEIEVLTSHGGELFEWENDIDVPGMTVTNYMECMTISGTPSEAGTYTVKFTVQEGGQYFSETWTFTVKEPERYDKSLNVGESAGNWGVDYGKDVVKVEGFNVPGLSVKAGGTDPNEKTAFGVTGAPTSAGTYNCLLKVTLGDGSIVGTRVVYTITDPNIVTAKTETFTTGTAVDKTYSISKSNIDGMVKSGTIPEGLSFAFRGNDLALSGTPTTAGTYSANVEINFSDRSTETFQFTITVKDPEIVYIDKTATVYADIDNKVEFTAAHNVKSASTTEGSLPDGMKLSIDKTTVTIAGKPSKAGDYTVKYKLEEEGGTEYVQFKITVEKAPEPKVTKSPTDEKVVEGEYCYMVARADYATEFTWQIVSPDGKTIYDGTDAEDHFDDLKITGTDKDTLKLSNIPYELDGWKVQCKFKGPGGEATSKSAKITVQQAKLDAPAITSQPGGADLKEGQTATLSVDAKAADGCKLKYQWYRSETNNTSGGTPIDGATSASYTPEEQEGTVYYYVSVWNMKDDLVSPAAVSRAAAVTYTVEKTQDAKPDSEPDQPAADGEHTEQGSGTENTGNKGTGSLTPGKDKPQDNGDKSTETETGKTDTPAGQTEPDDTKKDKSGNANTLIIVAGVCGTIAIVAICATVIYSVRSKQKYHGRH